MTSDRQQKLDQIVLLLKQAQKIATELGFINLFQPGLAKEMITASILDHEVHTTKHEADAWDPKDPNVKYEYLSCWEGGTFQLDRMFKFPEDKRQRSLQRITRNDSFFCVVFKKESLLDVKTIYKIPTQDILLEAERQLFVSSNDISHVGFTIKWANVHGEIVYSG